MSSCCFTLNGKAYVVGGKNNDSITDAVYEFDNNSTDYDYVCKAMTPYPTKVILAYCFTINGSAYIMHGTSGAWGAGNQMYEFYPDNVAHPLKKKKNRALSPFL